MQEKERITPADRKITSMEYVLVDISNEMRLLNRKADAIIEKVNDIIKGMNKNGDGKV